MIQRDSLASLTLDTLPFNIAVLDEEGTILFTNKSWREFGDTDEGEMIGASYFAGVDETADEYAQQAITGIQDVIEESEDVFTMEYPCHTPEQKQWFLMRAVGLPDHETGQVVIAHIDITQRKLAELRARDRKQELEQVMGRIEGLVRTVMETTLQATSREEIEDTLCRQLVSVDSYGDAWIGRVDLQSETITPTAGAGNGTETQNGTLPEDADDPTARALRTGQTQIHDVGETTHPIHHNIQGQSATKTTPTAARTLGAFPLVYGDMQYGVLTVYTDGGNVFDDREIAVLEVLARVVSTAINAIESKRILTSDRIIEVELALTDEPLFLSEIAATLACTLVYEGSISHPDGTVTMLFVVSGAAPEDVLEQASAHENIEDVTHVSENEEQSVFEFRLRDPPLISQLAERGVETTAIDAHENEIRITLELPPNVDVRSVVEQLSGQYPSTELIGRHEHEHRDRTKQELLADIEEKLTDRQRLALQKAFLGGFFEWPRNVSGEELAESMDISSSTYHQHLRSAERKLIGELFEQP